MRGVYTYDMAWFELAWALRSSFIVWRGRCGVIMGCAWRGVGAWAVGAGAQGRKTAGRRGGYAWVGNRSPAVYIAPIHKNNKKLKKNKNVVFSQHKTQPEC